VKRFVVFAVCVSCTRPHRTLTIIGTSDLHGHVERLPLLGGYVGALRAKRQVLLLDGGDLFQGTIISNRAEGAPVVRAMNALGYVASAVGNHEFDYGQPSLQARAKQAQFHFLDANIIDEQTGAPAAWPGMAARMMIDVDGIKVGLTGGTTKHTRTATNPQRLRGLRIEKLEAPIRAQAEALRKQGAEVIVVAVHAGGRCRDLDHPDDLSTCEADSEVFQLAQSLPPGLVDVIVGGHTHQAIAQRVNGIAILQAWLKGEGFGRVDITLSGGKKSVRIFPPRRMQPDDPYEGARVAPDATIAATFADDIRGARAPTGSADRRTLVARVRGRVTARKSLGRSPARSGSESRSGTAKWRRAALGRSSRSADLRRAV
jgi:5'-nucleotidase